MGFEVIFSEQAEQNLDRIINYCLYKLKNTQAAMNILSDAEDTLKRLSNVADSLKLCENTRLHDLGYRKIHFKRHNYFMLYRIEGNKAYVDAVYHDLQDYENIIN